LTYLKILAEDAPQITVAEKNISYSV